MQKRATDCAAERDELKLQSQITLPSKEPFAFAGLWEQWHSPDTDDAYKSCTIITTDASDSVREIHDRMPAILLPESYMVWLDPENQDTGTLETLLKEGVVRDLAQLPCVEAG